MKLRALTTKGAASPSATISAPASAGPMARLTFTPTPFSDTAAVRCSRPTRPGTMACHAGAMKAAPLPSTKVNSSSSGAVIAPAATTAASAAAATAIAAFTASSRRRRSTTSASAPAGSANRNTGSVVAACTSATIAGDGASVVISHPAPTSFIHVPVCDRTVATQSTAKGRLAKGAKAEGACGSWPTSAAGSAIDGCMCCCARKAMP